MHKNHRRKIKYRCHKGYFQWSGAKAFRTDAQRMFRTQVRDLLQRGLYDEIPENTWYRKFLVSLANHMYFR